jgi:FkbH-like protein
MTNADVRAILAAADDGSHASRLAAVDALTRSDYSWPRRARVRILRNYTLEPLESFLRLAAYRRRVDLDLSFGDFDAYLQEILDSGSMLNTSPPDAVVLALWLESLPMAFDREGRLQTRAVIEHVCGAVAQVRARVPSLLCLNTFLPPGHRLGYPSSGEMIQAVREVNGAVEALAMEYPSVFVVDFDRLQAVTGESASRDSRYWHMFKAPLGAGLLGAWGDLLAQVLASTQGGARKVLALDCDNTLWGGIVGEDGVSGIKLDPHAYPGNAFVTFQRQLVALQEQGVLLVLCSKNNERDVLEVLDDHPACVLRREHLAGWRINWEDKASNLKELADELSLGLESFVFLDDSSLESDFVRQTLPVVDVLTVPAEPYALPGVLARYNGFFSVVRAPEDLLRTQHHAAERERHHSSSLFAGHEEFLASLDLVAEVGPAVPHELDRVAQLTQKTNQFNLTTKRYSAAEIRSLAASERSDVIVLNARDRYGEYGLTGVAVLTVDGGSCRIDTFLLSCRVLGRHFEDVLLDAAIDRARERWPSCQIVAEFIETPKNTQVAQFFPRRGFEVVAKNGPSTSYRIGALEYKPIRPAGVTVRRRVSEWKTE